jgi:hypothetical protein
MPTKSIGFTFMHDGMEWSATVESPPALSITQQLPPSQTTLSGRQEMQSRFQLCSLNIFFEKTPFDTSSLVSSPWALILDDT